MFRLNRKRFVSVCLLLVSLSSFIAAQTPDPSQLTLERIYTNNEFGQKGVGGFKWLKGNSYAKLEPSPTIKGSMDLVSYDIASNERRVLIAAEKLVPAGAEKPLAINGYEWSADDNRVLIYTNSKKVWRQNTRGDYWILETGTGKLTKLGGDAKPSTMMFAKLSPDGTRVGYVQENDLYVQNIADWKITRLTKDGSHTLINGTSDWVNEEELDLRDCWRWSPDGKSIAFWQFDASGIKDFVLLDQTKGIYPELTYIPYPKAGTVNAAVRVGVVSADGGAIKWMNTPGDPRDNYIAMMDWTDNSNEIILQHLNRLQNQNQLMVADAKTGAARTIVTEKDDAWVDVEMTKMRWLDSGRRFLWMSERDGWRHVYSIARDGSGVKLITPGEFDVVSIQSVDEPAGWMYYAASPGNATQRYLFRTRLDGSGAAERVTPANQSGWNNYNISPNSRYAVRNYSSFGVPAKFEVVDLANKSTVRTMEDNAALQAKLSTLKKAPSEFFRIDIGDGVTLDGWMIKPPDFDAGKKYPVLFFAYGEPAGQTVLDSWFGNDYMWYQMLANQGYIIASVDNRGTPAPRGRAWRKSIYKKNGVINSGDQAAAVKAIEAKMPFVDASRIGIWGWSGGGSSTLNAMFRYPDIYQMGMAVAPEADIRYYDTIYTERYMGLPQDNPEEYKQGSPITFVNGLKGDLLIVHGTGDDNVHYQATEYLINALVTANKPFTMMAYPNRTHSISEGDGTTRHLYELLTRYLKAHLPAGPK
jgi:dipeptidyl-peptidase-4